MNIERITSLTDNLLLPTYKRNDVEFIKGRKAHLWDDKGRKYLDFLSGLGVSNLGYGHPKIKKAVKKSAIKPFHVSNLFQIENQVKLAKAILPSGFDGKTFFCNSGTEANESAYKFSIKYGKTIHADKIQILTANNAFHGRTFASLSLTDKKKIKEPFSPLLSNITHFKLNDEKDFLAKMKKNVAAVILECVQGEAGVYIVSKPFLKLVSQKCREHQCLLIIDEVQSGNFRTGRQYAFEHHQVQIDGFTTAKALANGLPIGAFTVNSKLASVFAPGDHGTTFGGNPFVTGVGLATLKELKKIGKGDDLKQKIKLFSLELIKLKNEIKFIKEFRQLGMMMAIEFEKERVFASQITKECLKKGLIIINVGENILRLLPPLVIKKSDIKKGMTILKKAILQNRKF